jgi:hypothetical protein
MVLRIVHYLIKRLIDLNRFDHLIDTGLRRKKRPCKYRGAAFCGNPEFKNLPFGGDNE